MAESEATTSETTTTTTSDAKDVEQAVGVLAGLSTKRSNSMHLPQPPPPPPPPPPRTTSATVVEVQQQQQQQKQPLDQQEDKNNNAAPAAAAAAPQPQNEAAIRSRTKGQVIQCSACGKVIPNQITDGHGVSRGHVGQFPMLIAWTPEPDGTGILCSRCYQKNWRTNKQQQQQQRSSTASGCAGVCRDDQDGVPRNPYACVCGASFQSSQLKAAHCRLCDEYRRFAETEMKQQQEQQQQEQGDQQSPQGREQEPARSRHRKRERDDRRQSQRPLTTSDPAQRWLLDAGLSPPAKVRLLASAGASMPGLITPLSCAAQPMVGDAAHHRHQMVLYHKVQLCQLLQTSRLLGQVDPGTFATLFSKVLLTSDDAALAETAELIVATLFSSIYSQGAAPPPAAAAAAAPAAPAAAAAAATTPICGTPCVSPASSGALCPTPTPTPAPAATPAEVKPTPLCATEEKVMPIPPLGVLTPLKNITAARSEPGPAANQQQAMH